MQALSALPPLVKLLIPVAITAWMLAVAILDHRSGRIPNALTAPVIFGVGALRLAEGFRGQTAWMLMLVAWAVVFGLWMLHFIGGGDAKFLMGEFALFPSMEFVALLALVLLVITLPLLILELRGRRLAELRSSVGDRVVLGRILPTEEDLQTRGRRYAWTFAIPGILYTWVYWRELGAWF
jgi:Flp pilus assembly protein protease CpaA